jgi:hypothetical protein
MTTDYIFGANILENLTTGMYQDSKIIYREYIQNACDQIDKAIKDGILEDNEGKINIWLDPDQRKIIIEDNATGIPASSFQETLGNIADSDKKIGEDKGFRGIGRLCGLAYCKELVFRSSAKGEDTESILVCNAENMRRLIDENNRGKKHTANEVLHAINHFDREKTDDIDSHFFRVELNGINTENTDLLNFKQVKDYLSFVAPVQYQNTFCFRTKVYKHAEELNTKIDEYDITLNGESIFKKYTTILKDSPTGTKYDEIFDVDFKDFYENGELIAWMWFGLSNFKKAIPRVNQMRNLRLRKENIQIGGEDALQKLFKEERGNNYFIGEVFAVHKDLIPNSQRDYFNENPTRAYFENGLRKFFEEELYKTYRVGSIINSALKKNETYEKKDAEFKEKDAEGGFVNKKHRDSDLSAISKLKKEAIEAQGKIDKIKEKANGLVKKVIERVELKCPDSIITDPEPLLIQSEDTVDDTEEHKMTHRVDKLSQYSRAERRLISKIFEIILTATDSETAEMIIRKIEDVLK